MVHGRESYWKALTSAMIRRSQERAEEKGLDHSITLEYLREDIYPETDKPMCPYCERPMKTIRGPFTRSSPTLDKVKPKLGYIEGNVIVACNGCNHFKNDTESSEEMRMKIKIAKTMLKKLLEVENNPTIILHERKKKA